MVISIALLVAMLMCMWTWLWHWLPSGKREDSSTADTLRVVVYDTIPYYMPVPKDSTVIRYVTQRLPVVDDKEDNFPNKGNNEEQNIPQSDNKVSENIPDSADVVVPITQKVYEDSTYTAYVSGYCARLDSLIFRMPREVTTITNTHYQKPKRWSMSVSLGMGLVYDGRWRVGPGALIGASFDF